MFSLFYLAGADVSNQTFEEKEEKAREEMASQELLQRHKIEELGIADQLHVSVVKATKEALRLIRSRASQQLLAGFLTPNDMLDSVERCVILKISKENEFHKQPIEDSDYREMEEFITNYRRSKNKLDLTEKWFKIDSYYLRYVLREFSKNCDENSEGSFLKLNGISLVMWFGSNAIPSSLQNLEFTFGSTEETKYSNGVLAFLNDEYLRRNPDLKSLKITGQIYVGPIDELGDRKPAVDELTEKLAQLKTTRAGKSEDEINLEIIYDWKPRH